MLERPVGQRRRKENYYGFRISIRVASQGVLDVPTMADGMTSFFPLLILCKLTSEFKQFCAIGSLNP
jgi:hypothetical protein